MKKRPEKENKPLDFNFDEPVSIPSKPDAGFESEIRSSESFRWGRRETSRRPQVLTPEEVMGVRQPRPAEKPARPTQPIPMKPATPAPTAPTPEASSGEGELSFAARMILRRMQEAEAEATAAEPETETTQAAEPTPAPVAPAEAPAEEKAAPAPTDDAAKKPVMRRIIPEFETDTIDLRELGVVPPETIPMTPAHPVREEAHTETPAPIPEPDPAPAETPVEAPVEAPAEAPTETPAMAEAPLDGATRVIETPAPAAAPTPTAAPSLSAEEAAFAEARRAYVEAFSLDVEGDIDVPADGATRAVPPPAPDTDFDILPETEPIVETIDDYRSVEDADAVYTDFMHRRGRLRWRSLVSLVLTVLLALMTFVDRLVPFGQPVFFVTMAVLLGIGALCNLSLFSSLGALFRRRCDVDFAPTLALIAALVQTGVCIWLGSGGLTATAMLAVAAMLAVTFNDFGKLAIVKRVLLNFEAVGNEETKSAAALVGGAVASRIADPARVGESLIVGRAPAIDLSSFLAYSLSPDPYEGQTFRLMILSLAGGLVSALLTLLVGKGSVPQAITAFATVTAVCAPLTAFLSTGRHFLHTCRQLRSEGAMLSGYRAAEDISEANVVALNADELFADECVSLYNFKTFYEFPFDDAIITAAALTKEGHSPLAGMFNQIVASNAGKLPTVDTVIYEDHMGLTGWVNDRKTLIGNRMILESHNIPAPPLSLDKKIVASGKFPVYLAVEERLVAIFIVGYQADRDLLHRVRRLINTGVTLLVDTADPNVTDRLVAERYGIPQDAVLVMSADAARRCREQFAPREREAARMTATNVRGYLDGYLASYRLRQSASFTALASVVAVCLGVTLAILLPLLGLGHFVNVIAVLGFHALTYLGLSLVHRFYRL